MSEIHKNPSLSSLNTAYRQDDAERKADVSDTVQIVTASLQQALTPSGRRMQKPVVAPVQRAS